MKSTTTTYAHRRTWTLEKGDFDESQVEFDGCHYGIPSFVARRALLQDVIFCSDVVAYGFPTDFIVNASDTSDTFDVTAIWESQY